jgi:uncharacterized protein YbjT (DUF2867 family)
MFNANHTQFMKTLVIGGTGTVGSQVVRQLLRHGQPVRVLVTSPQTAALLPEGAEPVIGDLDLPATLPPAFEGIGSVFLVNRHSFTEVAQGAYVLAAAKRAGVRKIVYQSRYNVRSTGAGVGQLTAKISIENMLARTGLAYTLVSPTHFYQNDLSLCDEIAGGMYSQPLGNVGVSRVDARDVAEVAVQALLGDRYDGLNLPVAGPEALTGESTARILGDILGHRVAYVGDDLGRWAESAKRRYPGQPVADWVKLYGSFQAQGLVVTAADLSLVTQLLGRTPRSYAAFVADFAQSFAPAPVTA